MPIKTFKLVVSVKAQVCENSPDFPEHAHATQWLFDVFGSAFAQKMRMIGAHAAKHKEGETIETCRFCKVMQREADAIIELRESITPVEGNAGG